MKVPDSFFLILYAQNKDEITYYLYLKRLYKQKHISSILYLFQLKKRVYFILASFFTKGFDIGFSFELALYNS